MEVIRKYISAAFMLSCVVLGLILAVLSRHSYGTALTTLTFAGLFFIYGVWKTVQAARGRDKWAKAVFTVSYSAVLILTGNVNLNSITRAHEKNFQPLIAALKAYKTSKGRYPDRVEDLVPGYIAHLPHCPFPAHEPTIDYYGLMTDTPKAGEQFIIQCVMGQFFFPQLAIYESDVPGWMYVD